MYAWITYAPDEPDDLQQVEYEYEIYLATDDWHKKHAEEVLDEYGTAASDDMLGEYDVWRDFWYAPEFKKFYDNFDLDHFEVNANDSYVENVVAKNGTKASEWLDDGPFDENLEDPYDPKNAYLLSRGGGTIELEPYEPEGYYDD